MIKLILRWLLTRLYGVEVHGLAHCRQAGGRVLIVANHTSYLDAALLFAFLPGHLTFAVNAGVARRWWVRLALAWVDHFPMEPANPFSIRGLVKFVQQGRQAVIFPEGRITVTGSLMKIYQGPGLVADRSRAALLPVRIDGAQLSPFSRLRGRERLRWFPRIRITVLPPRHLLIPTAVRGRARRVAAGRLLADLMTEMIFVTSDYRHTLFEALLDARRRHGGRRLVMEDVERRPVSYDGLIRRIFVLGRVLAGDTARGERVGLLLPNTVNTVAALFALQVHGRVPAMLNFSAGARNVLAAAQAVELRIVVTSRRFVQMARLAALIERLEERLRMVYLEDLRDRLQAGDRLRGVWCALFARTAYNHLSRRAQAGDPAVVLFTSGSEGVPKGVVLSHANLLANRAQLAARLDFNAQDIILNALPMFHSFGLTAGTLLPLLSGMKTFFYPNPLHYRIIPELAYDLNATILFGTNTFLAGYARYAHPYDFYSMRYVFAGAEKLHDETRRVWAEKFGLRVLEGYGSTETAPVLAVNTPMDFRAGSVGRLIPGIEYELEPVPGVSAGGRLLVRGPNIMLGYLRAGRPGVLEPPAATRGNGWYDTGDIARVDDDGFVWLLGRARRFAKIGGEMVSLAAVEDLAARLWPKALHAAINLPDPRKGERIALLTTQGGATREQLAAFAKQEGAGELMVPRRVAVTRVMPVLGSGKVDYGAVRELLDEQPVPPMVVTTTKQ
ncbi:MAG TPA: acyl-[ACP]--phospholipid O-acyltransferase [Gammaproteobacteria bacterium]|nr:acyl-[ACP]--phospholipid O-acyltransferase [Gammaproteobacteria bacterium]